MVVHVIAARAAIVSQVSDDMRVTFASLGKLAYLREPISRVDF
jgi:hypothetical protein